MRKIKNIMIFILILCIFSLVLADEKINDIQINSKACILLNADTSEILYGKNENEKMYPASTTKILTAIIALENLSLNEIIKAPSDFQNPEINGSNIAIDQNEEFTFEQILNALLISSANDAAHLLALHIAGSEEEFAKMMNEKIKSMGLKNTNFVNSHGLFNENHYTTCYDLAIIANNFIKKNVLKDIVNKVSYTIPPTNKKKVERNYILNTNQFIRQTGLKIKYNNQEINAYDPNISGIKTGYTPEAGRCLIGYIELNGKRMISVVLGADSNEMLYSDSKTLLYYGVNSFKTQKIVAKDEVVTNINIPNLKNSNIPLVSSQRIMKTVKNDFNKELLECKTTIYEDKLYSEIKLNEKLGVADFYYDNNFIGSVDLLSSIAINKQNILGTLKRKIKNNIYTKILFILFKILLSFIIWFVILAMLNHRWKLNAQYFRKKNLKKSKKSRPYKKR